MIETIITSLVTGLLSSGLLTWYFQERIKQKYQKELETHINELRHKSDLALKDVELRASEYNIRLTTYFPKQADAISELYSKMVHLKIAIDKFAEASKTTVTKSTDQLTALGTAYVEFDKCFQHLRLFIPKDTRNLIITFQKSAANNFTYNMLRLHNESPNNVDLWHKETIESAREMPKILEAMETDFQVILGIEKQKIL